jgi:hypothetical protein
LDGSALLIEAVGDLLTFLRDVGSVRTGGIVPVLVGLLVLRSGVWPITP